jgi:hypothetical protein
MHFLVAVCSRRGGLRRKADGGELASVARVLQQELLLLRRMI